jgi:AcrR family transcriptional regulator
MMTVVLSQSGDGAEDGRHLRRRRNRDAAIDALIELIEQGVVNPSVADVAERAGVSARSLFRYFDDVSDLGRAAITRMSAQLLPIVGEVAADPSLPLEQRIDHVATTITRMYGLVRTMGLAARSKAPSIPAVADQLIESRRFVRAHLERTFAPELGACAPEDRAEALARIDIWCTFEVQHLLHSPGAVEGADPVRVTRAGLAAALGAT